MDDVHGVLQNLSVADELSGPVDTFHSLCILLGIWNSEGYYSNGCPWCKCFAGAGCIHGTKGQRNTNYNAARLPVCYVHCKEIRFALFCTSGDIMGLHSSVIV